MPENPQLVTYNILEFVAFIEALDPELCIIAGRANIIECVSRMLVLEHFSKWRKMKTEEPALAAGNKND